MPEAPDRDFVHVLAPLIIRGVRNLPETLLKAAMPNALAVSLTGIESENVLVASCIPFGPNSVEIVSRITTVQGAGVAVRQLLRVAVRDGSLAAALGVDRSAISFGDMVQISPVVDLDCSRAVCIDPICSSEDTLYVDEGTCCARCHTRAEERARVNFGRQLLAQREYALEWARYTSGLTRYDCKAYEWQERFVKYRALEERYYLQEACLAA